MSVNPEKPQPSRRIDVPLDDSEPCLKPTAEQETIDLHYINFLAGNIAISARNLLNDGYPITQDFDCSLDANGEPEKVDILLRDNTGKLIKSFKYEKINDLASISVDETEHGPNGYVHESYSLLLDTKTYKNFDTKTCIHSLALTGGEELVRENEYIPIREDELPGNTRYEKAWLAAIKGYEVVSEADYEGMIKMLLRFRL